MPPRDTLRTARPRAQLRAGVRDWYRIVNKTGDAAAVYVYDEIGFFGISAQQFIDELAEIDAGRIDLHLNTPGGEVWDGLAIHNALRQHKATVTVHVDALAASIGSVIAMAGDRVVMGRGAQMMIHDALGVTVGNAEDHRQMVELLDRASDSIAGFYAERAGGTVEQWRNRMRDETWYFGAEAVKAGLADEVVGGDEAGSGPQVTASADSVPDRSSDWDLTIFRYAGRNHAPAPPVDGPQPPQPLPGMQVTYNGTPVDPASLAAELLKLATRDTATTSVPSEPSDDTTDTGPQPTVPDPDPDPADVQPAPVDQTVPVVVDGPCPTHHTDTVDRTWDSGTHEGRLESPMTLATARQMYGWYDGDRVEDGRVVKDACKLPHHEVSTDGTPGPANLVGVRNALARLSQSDIPQADQDRIRSHLQTHLDDAPEEEPENKVQLDVAGIREALKGALK